MPRATLLLMTLVAGLALAGCPSDPQATAPDAADTGSSSQPDTVVAQDMTEEAEATPDPRCCPAGTCPFGEFCLEGACHAVSSAGACYRAGECQSGQVCEGATICACGDSECSPEAGRCRWPEPCCNHDADCSVGETCSEGVCRPAPAEGACWMSKNCKAGEVCEGLGSCPCGASGCEATPGHCSLPGVCCLTDEECGPLGRCVASSCVPAPQGAQCFGKQDCGGSAKCAGPYLCPCGDPTCAVPTTPGVCTAADICCKDASDCPPTAICVDGQGCVPIPGGDQCYVDAHCGPGRVCEGGHVCPCADRFCLEGDTLGSCRTLAIPCKSDAECSPGMRCVIPDSATCPSAAPPTKGVCVQEVDQGCWSSDDCSAIERCSQERVCTHVGGCTEPNVSGVCLPFVDEGTCCDSHRECGPGYECRNSNTSSTCPPNPTAVCLPEPDYGESCWNYLDCPTGLVCNKSWVCACNARCKKSHMGYCSLPTGQNCKTDIDCGTSYSCARDWECTVNPCYNTTNCPLAGSCQPVEAGKCWNHNGCGSGQYCQGLRVCPSDVECADPDKPGVCAPEGDSGDCCDSFYGCASGLRCVSGIGQTECALDLASSCVPTLSTSEKYVICYVAEDCAPGRRCEGAEVCPCGLTGCDHPPVAGSCVPE